MAVTSIQVMRDDLSSTEGSLSYRQDNIEFMEASPDRVARIQAEWRRERPELDVSPQGVIGRLHRVAALLTDELVAVYGRYGLNEGDFDVLATLRRSGTPYARAAGDLADHTMITTGGLTKRVDRLVAKGLVERRPGTADARQRIVALTPAGLELIDAAFAAHMDNEHRLIDEIGRADAARLELLLERWLRILGDE
jgi:DNA-binding MarR family transcriptional regulator